MIEGVKVLPLRQIPDERGTVMHMLKSTDPHFIKFGEIYFTTVHAGVVKGWHKHERMVLNYACVYGRIKLVLYDDRDGSPTSAEVMELFLGPDEYQLVQIPTNVWNSFKGIGTDTAIVANCATEPHTKEFTSFSDPFDTRIPYSWADTA
jgi:dTDP-4-dehydrorhamnose 3,5-epimerase